MKRSTIAASVVAIFAAALAMSTTVSLVAQPPQEDFQETLAKLRQQAAAAGTGIKLEEKKQYKINGRTWRVASLLESEIKLELVPPPPDVEPDKGDLGGRFIQHFDRRFAHEWREAGAEIGYSEGWGLIEHWNLGAMGGDGWADRIGIENALKLAGATSSQTRWTYHLAKADRELVEMGYEEGAASYDGLILIDVETWNLALLGGHAEHAASKVDGVEYHAASDSLTFDRAFLERQAGADVGRFRYEDRIAVHPFAVDLDGDQAVDGIRISRADMLEGHIAIAKRLRTVYPNATIGAYDFPSAGYWDKPDVMDARFVAWEETIASLRDAGALDVLVMPVYDFYSHLFRFPNQSDESWASAKLKIQAQDQQKFGELVRRGLELAERVGMPLYLYTMHSFHMNGKCDRAGLRVPREEWIDHVAHLASIRTAAGTGVEKIALWGADEYYWNAPCYRPALDAAVIAVTGGTCVHGADGAMIVATDDDFDEYRAWLSEDLISRCEAVYQRVWGKTATTFDN